MTKTGPFLFLVLLLFVAGIGIATLRHVNYRIPILPGEQQTVWQVEARIDYFARSGASQVYLTLPPEQYGFRVVGETSASPGFGFNVEQGALQSRAHWTKREAQGAQTLFYELEVVQDPLAVAEHIEPAPVAEARWQEPYRTAAQQMLDEVLPWVRAEMEAGRL